MITTNDIDRISAIFAGAPAWARLALTSGDERLRARGADELSALLIRRIRERPVDENRSTSRSRTDLRPGLSARVTRSRSRDAVSLICAAPQQPSRGQTMRNSARADGVSVHAIAGAQSVLLAMNATNKARRDLLGFA